MRALPDALSGARAVVVVLGTLVVAASTLGAWGVIAQPSTLAPEGLAFVEGADEHDLEYRFDGRQVVNGNAGVYVTDVEGDGWSDLLLVGSESRGPVLFRNTGGRFEQSDALPDAVSQRRIHSALFLDYDDDGLEDLLLLPDPQRPAGDYTAPATGGRLATDHTSSPLLLHNEGGTFAEPTVLEGVRLEPYPIGATSADYDGDGCLDVFVYQNGDWMSRTPVGYRNPGTVEAIADDNGVRNLLLRGDCRGGFVDVSRRAGIEGERWSLAASFVDFTGDGRPDLHVANDFNRDVVYRNRGDGTFAMRRLSGTDRNGMSSEIADVDGDGRPDVFVTNIGMAAREGADLSRDTGEVFDRQAASQSPRYALGNQLLVNRGNGTFDDRAGAYGVQNAGYVWGWAAVLADLDNDGDLDLVHTNNERSSVTSEGDAVVPLWTDTPPAVWENVGGPRDPSFAPVRAADVGLVDMNGRGMARLDVDRDGDLDLVVADVGGTVKLYENRAAPRHWLQVEVGRSRSAGTTGARIEVRADGRTHHRFANVRADYLSQETRVVHVGLGGAERVELLRVTWPDGSTTTLRDVRADVRVRVLPNGTVRQVPRGGPWIDLEAG